MLGLLSGQTIPFCLLWARKAGIPEREEIILKVSPPEYEGYTILWKHMFHSFIINSDT